MGWAKYKFAQGDICHKASSASKHGDNGRGNSKLLWGSLKRVGWSAQTGGWGEEAGSEATPAAWVAALIIPLCQILDVPLVTLLAKEPFSCTTFNISV